MQNILICRDLPLRDDGAAGTIDSKWLADTITLGGIGAFNVDGTIVPAAARFPGPMEIHVSRGAGNGTFKSPVIYDNNLRAGYFEYLAPSAKRMAIGAVGAPGGIATGLNLPAAIAAGDVATVVVYDIEKAHEDKSREQYFEYICRAGDTATIIINALVAMINARTNRIVTAANVGNLTLTLLSRVAGRNFGVDALGVLSNADICALGEVVRGRSTGFATGANANVVDNVTLHRSGSGANAMIQEKASDFDTERGDMKPFLYSDLLFTDPNLVQAGVNYDVFQIEWTTPNDNILMPKQNFDQVCYIAIPFGGANTVALVLYFNQILGLV